jgi:DsbC/DsbD-like thiol-disulfide interchange protein
MRALKIWLFGMMLASPAAFALSGNTVATENVKARLVSEVRSVAPGQVFWVALNLDIREGWHTYWRNPGDSGEATSLAWQLPPGFTAGDIVWTTPHRFDVAPLVNYGYAKQAVHLIQITAPKDLRVGTPVALGAPASRLVFPYFFPRQGRLAGLLRCLHSRDWEFAAESAFERPTGCCGSF